MLCRTYYGENFRTNLSELEINNFIRDAVRSAGPRRPTYVRITRYYYNGKVRGEVLDGYLRKLNYLFFCDKDILNTTNLIAKVFVQ